LRDRRARLAPDQQCAARELARVCRAGGRIGLASWTPEGFVGQWFQLGARYAPPPGVRSPLVWGTEAGLRELLGDVGPMRLEKRLYVMRYASPRHWLDFFRANFGPVRRIFESLDEARQKDYAAEQLELLKRFNRSGDETLVLPGEYLEAIIDRK
jgi:SAM-dependent methyltransferase